jgi:hypothetical protein
MMNRSKANAKDSPILLSRAYRAIYVIARQRASFVSVEEVSKHDC